MEHEFKNTAPLYQVIDIETGEQIGVYEFLDNAIDRASNEANKVDHSFRIIMTLVIADLFPVE